MDEQPTRIHELGDERAWSDVIGDGPPLPPAPPAGSSGGRRFKTLATGAGLVLGGVLAGTVAVSAAQGLTGHGAQPTAVVAQAGGGAGAGAPGLGSAPQPQQGFGGRSGGGLGGGGLAGEQRLSGTVAAVGSSSLSVTTASGTVSYAVTAQTEIVKDGQPVGLSALQKGDAVFLHVYPSGSGMAAERIFAGNPPAGGPGPGGPGLGGPGRDDGSSAGSGVTGRST
jgi:hypothetical protein